MRIYIKWGLIVFVVIAGLIILLNITGKFFVTELVQNVILLGAEEKTALQPAGGKRAPYFNLPDLSGRRVASSDALTKPMVLLFWTTWNNASVDQLAVLDTYVNKQESLPFAVFTVNSQEDAATVKNFIRRGEYRLPVLLDERGALTEQYQARTLPATYFIGADGFIKDVVVGVMSEQELTVRVKKANP